ncbi:MAG TPA: hypothetical protein VGP95_11455 [Gemmatimonadaceae bacterium]|nr:hypothetical protein [Gemmatimonadaceae bacterium]
MASVVLFTAAPMACSGMGARGADPLFWAKRETTRLLDVTISRQAAVLACDHVSALVSSAVFCV